MDSATEEAHANHWSNEMNRTSHLISLFVLPCIVATPTLEASVVPFELDSMDVSVFPFQQDMQTPFAAVDATGFFGLPAGTPIYLANISAAVDLGSGDPTANQGSFDLSTYEFEINWAAAATFLVFDDGGNIIGSGLGEGIVPESGTLLPTGLPNNFFGSLSTNGSVPMALTLTSLVGSRLVQASFIDIDNEKEVDVDIDIETGDISGALIDNFAAPSLTFHLPSELGSGVLLSGLEGDFHASVVPAPSAIGLFGFGFLLSHRRRR